MLAQEASPEIKKFKMVGNSSIVDVFEDNNTHEIKKLTPGIWRVDPGDGLRLKYVSKVFKKMKKVYGNKIQRRSKNVIDDLMSREDPLGAMIVGTKGNGKSALGEYICNELVEKHDFAILQIKDLIKSGKLESIIRAAGDCVVYIDEYSKYYSPRGRNTTGGNQEADYSDELLTLMSDKSLGRVLWLISDNEMRNISEYLQNRTGRVMYRFVYKYVEEDVVEDICKDYKISPEITEFLKDHAKNSGESIDNILSLAEKCIQRKCKSVSDFQTVFEELNVRPPMFRVYQVKTDTPDKLKMRVEGEYAIFTVTEEKTVKGPDDSIIAEKGDNVVKYKIASLLDYRNRRGSLFGVNYAIAFKNKPEKPDDEYEADVIAAPASEFKRSYFF